MSTNRKLLVSIVYASALLVLAAAIGVAHYERISKPLGEAPPIKFESTSAPDGAERQFLDADFVIIKDVNAFPKPVLQAFTEVGGSRPVMANPGKKFEATDFIVDASLPRERLILAGISGDKFFVHYQTGGLGRWYALALFRLTSAATIRPIWEGRCGPVENITELRSQVARGCPPA